MIRDGTWPNPAGLLGNAGRRKAPLRAVPGAHTSSGPPISSTGPHRQQPASSQLEQEHSEGTSLKPESQATGLPTPTPQPENHTCMGDDHGQTDPEVNLSRGLSASKLLGYLQKRQSLGRIPDYRVMLLGRGVSNKLSWGFWRTSRVQNRVQPFHFTNEEALLLMDLMLINFNYSFPGCKVTQTPCGKFGKNEKISRKLKSLIITARRTTLDVGKASSGLHSWAER